MNKFYKKRGKVISHNMFHEENKKGYLDKGGESRQNFGCWSEIASLRRYSQLRPEWVYVKGSI